METFDDFDTQIQSDELSNPFYLEYEVDCDDGTQGEKVYIINEK